MAGLGVNQMDARPNVLLNINQDAIALVVFERDLQYAPNLYNRNDVECLSECPSLILVYVGVLMIP